MEPFLDIFFAVDRDHTETISAEELRDYVARNDLDKNMITQWNRLFDPEKTGIITFAKFCDVLGIAPDSA
ncbi:Tegument antigen [Fasciola gigantica]|uniref:Tegument antigen n=1 Tax=Fasciola gigantica TaxID=46835 RepID=A0A504Y828_FASGI|nr:Tegument antigen [Fasciola gigantica]